MGQFHLLKVALEVPIYQALAMIVVPDKDMNVNGEVRYSRDAITCGDEVTLVYVVMRSPMRDNC